MDPEVSFMVQSFREIDPSLQGVLIFYQKDFGSSFVWVSCNFPKNSIWHFVPTWQWPNPIFSNLLLG